MRNLDRTRRIYDSYAEADKYEKKLVKHTFYRERVADFLRRRVKQGSRVLDVGCGPGHLTRHLSKSVQVVGFDISEQMIATARRRRPKGQFHVHELHTSLPRSWGTFDAVVAVGCWEFCTNLELVLRNLSRAMKRGATLFAGVVEYRRSLSHQQAPTRRFHSKLGNMAMRLYSFRGVCDAAARSNLLPERYAIGDGWWHSELEAKIMYGFWELRRV